MTTKQSIHEETDKLFWDSKKCDEHLDCIKSFYDAQISKLLEEILPKEKEIKINSLEDVAMAMRKDETISEAEKLKIINKDNGRYVENVAIAAHNQTIAEIKQKIKEIGY